MNDSFGIHFGALCDPIRDQLKAQGLPCPVYITRQIQSRADSVVDLVIGGYLTDAEAKRARLRILKALRREIERTHKAKVQS